MASCEGSALVFSGRPDPVWPIDERDRTRLERLWTRLEPIRAGPPSGPVLGYKGACMSCASGTRYHAYHGVVVLTRERDVVEYRGDPDRGFERALLGTAPAGALPAGIGMPPTSGGPDR